ncbi:hypothetical protein [Brevundimonas denitrificans]|uniref:hypothetical protein n=1 Tax=Brevundimonas TaxID=41275 RepID=UPI00190FAA96
MSDTMKLDLPILLPGAPDASDACVGRLISLLRDEPGVSEAHVVEEDAAPRLCIHYDPGQLTLAEVRRRARLAAPRSRGATATSSGGSTACAMPGTPGRSKPHWPRIRACWRPQSTLRAPCAWSSSATVWTALESTACSPTTS